MESSFIRRDLAALKAKELCACEIDGKDVEVLAALVATLVHRDLPG